MTKLLWQNRIALAITAAFHKACNGVEFRTFFHNMPPQKASYFVAFLISIYDHFCLTFYGSMLLAIMLVFFFLGSNILAVYCHIFHLHTLLVWKIFFHDECFKLSCFTFSKNKYDAYLAIVLESYKHQSRVKLLVELAKESYFIGLMGLWACCGVWKIQWV